MFGYVRPLREELKVRDYERYQAVYCGLCHTIGRDYGFFARFFLNYDFTFLAMVLATPEETPAVAWRRCAACPLRGKQVCDCYDGMELAAAESLVLAWWKLRDTVWDEGVWRSLPARLLGLMLRPAYQKAARRCPEFDAAAKACLEELRTLEQANTPSLDRTADTFARILQAAAPQGEGGCGRPVGQMLYHVGRWIYLVDAWEDLEDDISRGRYNPVLARFGCREEALAQKEYLRVTLRHSRNLALSAFALADFGVWSATIENILCLGLPGVEELVFSGRWQKK